MGVLLKMEGAITWSSIVPIIATMMGALVSILLGIVISGQSEIKNHLKMMNSKLFTHITQNGIHESAVARIDEQLKALTNITKIAHERLDRMEQAS